MKNIFTTFAATIVLSCGSTLYADSIQWNKINDNYRDDNYDCRSNQRGVVPIDNQQTIKADWVLNNDFGAYIWKKNPCA